MKRLFESAISSRQMEMQAQAEELMRLRDEMTEVLERQIEASESEGGNLVEDYKAVLVDIKALVGEYIRSGDKEYLALLCSSLGIPQTSQS